MPVSTDRPSAAAVMPAAKNSPQYAWFLVWSFLMLYMKQTASIGICATFAVYEMSKPRLTGPVRMVFAMCSAQTRPIPSIQNIKLFLSLPRRVKSRYSGRHTMMISRTYPASVPSGFFVQNAIISSSGCITISAISQWLRTNAVRALLFMLLFILSPHTTFPRPSPLRTL